MTVDFLCQKFTVQLGKPKGKLNCKQKKFKRKSIKRIKMKTIKRNSRSLWKKKK